MKDQFVSKTFEIAPGVPDFHSETFANCTFILRGGDAGFFLCDFIECTFIPPLNDGVAVCPDWDDRMAGCVVSFPKTRVLIKREDVQAAPVPKLERPCRSHPGEPCYVPDRCVFGCSRVGVDRAGQSQQKG